jgi:ribosomal protein S18 acetylase RimI-like enzyme
MIEQLKVELARIADAGEIASMSRDLVERGLGWSWTRPRVADAVRHPDCNVAIVRHDAGIAGFGIMEYGLERAHLVLFAVRPEFRRKEVGTRILRWLEECAMVAGASSITLETRLSNEGARRFYGRHGYREAGRIHGYYSGRESAIRMCRRLRPDGPV